jgi:ATP-dependent DNA ligase
MPELLRPDLPAGPEWSHEVKWDGYRVLLHKGGERVPLLSPRHSNLTKSYPTIVAAAPSFASRVAKNPL